MQLCLRKLKHLLKSICHSSQVKVGKTNIPTTNVIQTLEKVSDKEKIDKLFALLIDQSSQA
jgi:hypothetical protein